MKSSVLGLLSVRHPNETSRAALIGGESGWAWTHDLGPSGPQPVAGHVLSAWTHDLGPSGPPLSPEYWA